MSVEATEARRPINAATNPTRRTKSKITAEKFHQVVVSRIRPARPKNVNQRAKRVFHSSNPNPMARNANMTSE